MEKIWQKDDNWIEGTGVQNQGRRNQGTKSARFVMKSALFVQTNVAVNTNLTSKVPFVFPKHIYVCPLTQDIAMLLIVF